jgi:hypothetical protein
MDGSAFSLSLFSIPALIHIEVIAGLHFELAFSLKSAPAKSASQTSIP